MGVTVGSLPHRGNGVGERISPERDLVTPRQGQINDPDHS